MQMREADNLETLQLTTIPHCEDPYASPVPIPDTFLKQRVPRLRRVALHGGFIFEWRSAIFTGGLTHLALSEIAPSALPSMKELLSLLRRCPGLQTLSLVSVLPALPEYPEDTMELPKLKDGYKKTKLPCMTRCYLEDHALEVVNFLRRVDIPQTCHVSLYLGRQDAEVDASGDSPSPFAPVCRAVRDFCLTRTKLHDASLRFEQRVGARIHWTFEGKIDDATDASQSVLEVSMGGTSDPSSVHVPVENAPPGSFLSAIFLMFSPAFPLATVRSAHFSVHSTTSIMFWDVMMNFPHLERIIVEGSCAHGLAELLLRYVEFPRALPHLRDVTIAHVDLSFPGSHPDIEQLLELALRGQRSHGRHVWDIKLEECWVDVDQRHRLEEAGGKSIACIGEPDVWEVESLEDDDSAAGDSVDDDEHLDSDSSELPDLEVA
ncbi:unnamed protein product [Peniophora sp. CBMAI 1063]|nr:unnamed protein product [Peniophora sp. CBMAI 1063]